MKMLKNGLDTFKSNKFEFVLYKHTLEIRFSWLLEAKSMASYRCLLIFDKNVKNLFRLDGSTRNFMIKTTVIVKNCLDLIFEGLRDMKNSSFCYFSIIYGPYSALKWCLAVPFAVPFAVPTGLLR